MKILFSADWHIKLCQKNVPREWQKARYEMLFSKLHEIQADIHIIGGDIFDKVPNPEELSLFFDFVRGVNIPTCIYDGNHEATRKGKTFLVFLSRACASINPLVSIVNGTTELQVKNCNIDVIPYTNLKTFNPDTFTNDILCTHVRGSIPPHVVPEIDLEKFSRWKTVLAGDLHSYENSQLNILYPGSPLSITFHRTKINNGVIIFDTDTHEHEWIDLKLPQLIRKTVSNKDEIIPTEYDHTIYEITGNILELSNIDTSSNLIDKKIISKKTDSILDLKNKSIAEELELYFREVIKLDQEDIVSTMRVFNDYYKEANME
jgi:DNA repair exonuclease SbcCD nuclease subunit